MLDSKNLETNIDKREESESQINLGYLNLIYNNIYHVGQCYVCINGNYKSAEKYCGCVSTNMDLSDVGLYDKNMNLIGQYNTEYDVISYTIAYMGWNCKWLVIQLQREQTVEDNYLVIINMNGSNGAILHNRQKINMLAKAGFELRHTNYTSDFWKHAMSINLTDMKRVNGYTGSHWMQGKEEIEIIINRETLKILNIFKDGYWDCPWWSHIETMDNDHVRSCISFYNCKDGIQAIEHKLDGSQISTKKFNTVENLFNTYKPLLHVPGDKNEYDYSWIGYTTDEEYFKFRGPLQSDNKLHKSEKLVRIEEWSLYVYDRALNLINIDGQKIDIETTGGKDQEEIVKAFGHEQTSSEQCITYIKQTLGDILTIVQNNTIIAGKLEGEKTEDLMLWHKFKIEYAFRNKIVNNVSLMYTWKFLEDSIQPLYKVYLCVEEYNSVQKQTSPVLLYNIHNGEAITDRDKINSLRKKFDGEIDRYSDRRGPDWKCLRETCSMAWDTRCNYRKKFESRRELYRTGRWA